MFDFDRRVAALFCVSMAASLEAGASAQAQPQSPQGTERMARQAPQFVENRGQWATPARFRFATAGSTTWLAGDRLLVQREQQDLGVVVQFRFVDAAGAASGEAVQPTLRHWLRADDNGGAITEVPAFARVAHRGLYAGIDMVLREQAGQLEYDLVCAEGADLRGVRVEVRGHSGLRLAEDGSLVCDTVLGELRQTPPVTWTTAADGARVPLPSRFVLLPDDCYGFAVDGWQGGALTIDPGIVWGSYLGGSGADACTGVAVDSTGSTIVCGTTASANLPTTVGVYRATAVGLLDAFVGKFSADGSVLQFCTYLGGNFDDRATAVQVLSGDRIFCAGETNSLNFPTTGNRYQSSSGGATDAFVLVLPPAGNTLNFASYFGGTGADTSIRARVQPNEDIWLCGRCTGSIPTTTNAYQTNHSNPGQGEVFLAVLDRSVPTSTQLRFGTYYGGTANEATVDSLHLTTTGLGQEIATIGLTTDSTDCATTANAYQTAPVGVAPGGMIVQFDPAQPTGLQTLLYATYFAAPGGSTRDLRVAVDSAGLMAFAATTSATTWATTAVAFQRLYGGGASDVLCGRFDPTRGAAALVLATYLGGAGDEVLEGFDYVYQTGSLDLASVSGSTTSTNFPVSASAVQSSMSGTGAAGFVAQLDYRLFLGLQLRFGTYFDGCGPGDEHVRGVVRTTGGELAIAGETTAGLVPGTATSFQRQPGGATDGFAARLDTIAQPAAFAAFGTGCGVPGDVPVLGAGQPPRICQNFAVNLTNLQPNGGGFMVLGFDDQLWLGAVPLPRDLGVHGMPGCNQYIDTSELFLVVYSGTSTTWGMFIPPLMDFYGVNFYLQFLMADARANPLGLAITNAGRLNVRF